MPCRQPQTGRPLWWLPPIPLYGLFPRYVLSAVSPALSHRLCLSQTHSSLPHLLSFLSPLPGALSRAQVEQAASSCHIIHSWSLPLGLTLSLCCSETQGRKVYLLLLYWGRGQERPLAVPWAGLPQWTRARQVVCGDCSHI